MGEEGDSNEKQTLVAGEAVTVNVNVKCSNGSKFSVRTSLESTVESFKVLVAQKCDVPDNQQRLIYNGRILKDHQTLLSYGMQADHCLHMVRGSAANSGSQNTTYEDLMNTPAIRILMNTPELMRILIMNNPQLREIVDHNSELGHILNDPSILRQTLEAARNPEEPLLNTTTVSGNATQGRDASNILTRTTAETGSGNTVQNTNPLPNPWGAGVGQTNSGGDTRVPGIGGLVGLDALGGLGMLGGDPTVVATPYASQMNQFLQNPAMSQMMQSLISNPQYMYQIMILNTILRSLMDSSPHMRIQMQNREFLQQFFSPEAMQIIMTLQQSLFSGATAGTGNNNEGMDLLMNMIGNLGGLSGLNQSNVSREELYLTELQQLEEMGFFDRANNIRALRATYGNVDAAAARLEIWLAEDSDTSD